MRFQCDQQDCTFGTCSRDNYTLHLFTIHKIHVGTDPVLKCAFCDYRTLRRAHLKKHELGHTALDYTIECPYEGCDKIFRQNKHLKIHVMELHEDLKLPCRYCDQVFASKKKLLKHSVKMHTEQVRDYKCPYCSHATVSRDNCRKHIQSAHEGRPVTVIDLRSNEPPSNEPQSIL